MWFRNRLVNPVVRLLLRSPLHPLLSGSVVLLTYQGRKTGRRRSLPCIYARDGQDLYVVPQDLPACAVAVNVWLPRRQER